MKHRVFTLILFCLSLPGMSQFVPQPLNYPGTGYWPYYISISDPGHVWVGTIHESGLIFPYSARTSDGGNTWVFDSIPVPGSPECSSICEWDSNTCFFVFTDLVLSGGTIWKTLDGGETWTNLTTNQFTGGYANFYHAFSADTGVAMGDPTNGYFEIQRTSDGGASWERVPSASIPVPLTGEYGLNDTYSAVGNSVWFTTNKGRCFRSTDRGLNWEVTEIIPGADNPFGVCFSTLQKGVLWQMDNTTSDIALTFDGGITWDSVPFPAGYAIAEMSRVAGFDGGFVVTAFKNYVDVFFTPDMFTTLVKIGSNLMSTGIISFYDAATGWLSGGESGTDEIYKFTGVLSAVQEAMKEHGSLKIVPNPTADEALLWIPPEMAGEVTALRVTGMTGKVICREPVDPVTGWTRLDATGYAGGIYLVELLSGDRIIGRERWVVNH